MEEIIEHESSKEERSEERCSELGSLPIVEDIQENKIMNI